VYPALEGAQELEAEHGLSVAVFNARFIKPLPREQLLELAARFTRIVTVEEGCLAGGFGSAVVELLADENALAGRTVRRVGLTDEFVEHGKPKELRARAGIDKGGIKRAVLEISGKTPAA
jgi:1-deoxy-D-xylulose-5-phosphate synthase